MEPVISSHFSAMLRMVFVAEGGRVMIRDMDRVRVRVIDG